jgi:hypothetical protein
MFKWNLYTGPSAPEPEYVQQRVALYNCLVESGIDIREITLRGVFSNDIPFVNVERQCACLMQKYRSRRIEDKRDLTLLCLCPANLNNRIDMGHAVFTAPGLTLSSPAA